MTLEKMPECVEWVINHFDGDWGKFNEFIEDNRRAGTWVDDLMCSATALYLGIFYLYLLDPIGSLVFTIVKLRERVREGLCKGRSLKVHNLSLDLTINIFWLKLDEQGRLLKLHPAHTLKPCTHSETLHTSCGTHGHILQQPCNPDNGQCEKNTIPQCIVIL